MTTEGIDSSNDAMTNILNAIRIHCMLCAYTRPRYQVNVYRTIGPLVF